MRRALLLSDLHLCVERPASSERFFRFVAEEAAGADAVYLLGDLFEYWVGDDELEAPDGDPLARRVVGALADLARRGSAIYVMQGNRDFLLGARWCAAAGATLLDDPALADLAGRRTLLMHGDTLCTEDHDYQAWRSIARSEAWQRDFLSKSLTERRRIASELREQSRLSTRAKPEHLVDVSAQAVKATMERYAVDRLIHGHTHRPARHELECGGRRCERWVLPDWYGAGGYLEAGEDGLRLVRY